MKMMRTMTAFTVVFLLTASLAFASHLWDWTQYPAGTNPGVSPVASKTVSTGTTLTLADDTVYVNAASAAVTITLPPVRNTSGIYGKRYVIKKTDSTNNPVIVAASTTDSETNYIGNDDSTTSYTSRRIYVTNGVMVVKLNTGTNWEVAWETPPFYVDMTTSAGTGYLFGNQIQTVAGTSSYAAPTAAVNATYTTKDCGKTIMVSTDALTLTLPAVTQGCTMTFINSGGGAGNNIIKLGASAAGDKFSGTVASAATNSFVIVTGGANYIQNTKATSFTGDRLDLIGGASNVWLFKATGIWTTL